MMRDLLRQMHDMTDSAFAALGLDDALLRALDEQGYSHPTAVQVAAIPAILRGADVLAAARTGSGKTAAFALPILQRLTTSEPDSQRRVRVLILVPTRELAVQVGEALRGYARYLPQRPKILNVYGGVSINPQMLALRGGAELVVATPGRLLDLIDHHALHLGGVSTLVLDEADRLLELGFAEELQRILALLPPRQNLLFSATFPDEVRLLAEALLREPTRIEVALTESRPAIQQRSIRVDAARRTPLLRHLIQTESWTRVLVFVATQYATEHVADKLRRAGLAAEALHGELSQGARTQALADFKASKVQVLIATDIAARGIDIIQLPVVVNYDLPRSAVDYTHRIGRTGRAGETGIAVSFVTPEHEAHFRLIEKRHQLRLAREEINGFEVVADIAVPVNSSGGIKGKRPNKKDKLRAAALLPRAVTTDEPVLRGADIWQRRKPTA